jgi:hypothetical protein
MRILIGRMIHHRRCRQSRHYGFSPSLLSNLGEIVPFALWVSAMKTPVIRSRRWLVLECRVQRRRDVS